MSVDITQLLRQIAEEEKAGRGQYFLAMEWRAILEIGGSSSDLAYEMRTDRRIPTWYRWQVVMA
jgi:hypothetical protein